MNYNLKIPLDKRYKFAEPLDCLISGTREQTIPKVKEIIKNYEKANFDIKLYTVGDIVTKDFLEDPYLKNLIKLSIIDKKTQRNRIEIETKSIFEEFIEFNNPEATIQKDSWSLLKNIIKSEYKTLLTIVNGEEDLLVLPLVLQIPLEKNVKNLVFYGQPPITDSKLTVPEGIVIVDVDNKIQKKVKSVIDIMEKF